MNNKSFIVLLTVATIMVFGVIAENTRSVIVTDKAEVEMDISDIKIKLIKAGLTPRDAMHWKEL